MYETILSPVNYGGLQLKNRIIFAPTTFGLPDEEYLAEIRRLAEGGCAMLIIGDVPVGKSKFEKSLFDAKGFAFYQQIVEIAHKADCKVCAQLHQSDSNMLAMLKYIPAVLAKKLTPDQLREKAERRSGALHHQNAEAEDRGHPRRLRQGGGAGKTGWVRHGAGARRPDVRQLQLVHLQSPHR